VGEQMALPGSRTNPDLVAARFLLKPGRKYEEAVKAFEPYDPKTGVVIVHHGGTCTLKGEEYIESVQYANPGTMNLIGHDFKFTTKLQGDTLTLTGIGNPWTQVWKRAK